MTREFFEKNLQAASFGPYSIHLSGGRVLQVTNPEFVMLADDYRSISLFEPQRAIEFIDLALIVSVRMEGAQS